MVNLSTDYARAYHPETSFWLFGRRLQTFCLGHELLLQAENSPLTIDARTDPSFGDLLLAVGICSRKPKRAARWVKSWRARLWLRWMRFLYKRQTERNEQRIWIFRNYIWAAWQRPRYGSDSGGKCGSPIMLVLKQTLMSVYGKTEDQAFDTPLRVALWDHIGWMEREGMAVVPPPIDPAVLEGMKAVAKDALKQWEAWKAKQPRRKA